MRLRKVRLKNGYKRFRDLTIDLGESPARIVALVGPNGCGKSSVLDGILYHANAFGAIGQGNNKDHTYHSMDGEPSVSWQNIELQFVEGEYQQLRESSGISGKAGTMFSFRSPYRYNSHLKIQETRATGEIWLNNYGAKDASSLDDKMEQNYRRLYAVYNRYLESADVKPSEAKAKIIGDLNESIEKCLDIKISSLGNIEDSRGTLYFTKPDHPKEFEFNVLSSGEKEVVDLFLDLYLRKDDFSNTVFLIDEPELHVNTSIQRNLLIEIDRLVGTDCQIWLTTHSIGLLRALQVELKDKCQIIRFKADQNLAAEAFIMRPLKITPSVWRGLFSVAIDDLAYLISPKVIVYCEGRADPGAGGWERGLDAKVFNSVFAGSYPDVTFISSGGNTELDQRSSIAISIIGKVFPTVEILVLKDRDMASGGHATDNDREFYLQNNPSNHRVLRRWEIENYLYDKEVLKKYCETHGLAFDDAAFEILVSDAANQNLKDATGRIKSICGIKTSINADTFKLRLAEQIDEGMAVYRELEECVFGKK